MLSCSLCAPWRLRRWREGSPTAAKASGRSKVPACAGSQKTRHAAGPGRGSSSLAVSAVWQRGARLQLPPACAIRHACNRSEEHTSELQSLRHLVCRLLLEKKKKKKKKEENINNVDVKNEI